MGVFNDMLGSEESLFLNPIALDYDFQPKLVPYRENEQHYIAGCIKPLFSGRTGRNLLVYGPPGVGKTVACKHLLNELEEETDEIIPVYINCWQKNTSYKILLEICDIIGYKFTQNKRTEELFKVIKEIINKKSAVFVFDEIDKLDDIDFLYQILEEIYKKTIVLITNYKDWVSGLDNRIKSRLTAELLEFRPYSLEETRGILKQRLEYAFVRNIWDEAAFELAARKAYELKDIRKGLFLLREAGNTAEDASSRKITSEYMKRAIEKLSETTIKDSAVLEEELRLILSLIKENSGKKIGEIYKLYTEQKPGLAYKTFQRRIKKLEQDKFISTSKITGGIEGKTTIINYPGNKKLTEF